MIDFIYEKSQSLTDDYCDTLIDYFEKNRIDNSVYSLYDKNKVTFPLGSMVDNLKLPINFENNKLIDELKQHISLYFLKLDPDKKIFFFENIFDKICIEDILISKYKSGDCKINYHNDYQINRDEGKQRVLKCVWYLNYLDEGGETEFFGNYCIKPEKGKLVIFPAEWFFPYTEKKSNIDKYIMTIWVYIDA